MPDQYLASSSLEALLFQATGKMSGQNYINHQILGGSFETIIASAVTPKCFFENSGTHEFLNINFKYLLSSFLF